jgi:hypothetical protein
MLDTARKTLTILCVTEEADGFPPFSPIAVLPNEVLLEMFDCHRLLALRTSGLSCVPWEWHRLAHVCSRWRTIIFQSQHRLNLQLVYTYKQPVRKTLEFWPTFPVAIRYPRLTRRGRPLTSRDVDNVIAALEHADRICELNVPMTDSLLAKSAALLQASFPTLQTLRLGPQETSRPLILPVGFLGGDAPRMRDIHLTSTAFSALPLLIQSARELVSLQLDEVPNSGHFSPEALAVGLSATTQLKQLKLYFQPQSYRPDQTRTPLPPKSRSMLPALTEIHFRGNSDYFEDLVSRIDAPAVEQVDIKFSRPEHVRHPTACPIYRSHENAEVSAPHVLPTFGRRHHHHPQFSPCTAFFFLFGYHPAANLM